MTTSEKVDEGAGRPDLHLLVDVTGGDWLSPESVGGIRVGVLSEIDEDTGQPRPEQEGIGIWDPMCLAFHDLMQDLPDGVPDRRMAIATVNDWDGEQDPPEDGMARFGQTELWSTRNRSTRERDATGRSALPSSQRKIVDAEDGRYVLALYAPGPGQTPPEATSVPAQGDVAIKWPAGVNVFQAGQRAGGMIAPADGISVGGATFFSGQAIAYANRAREEGGGLAEIGAAASAGSFGRPYPEHLENLQSSQERKQTPAPPGPVRNPAGGVAPSDRPGGYVTSTGEAHGLLGTFFDPNGAGGFYFRGGEGTPIGPLPARHDAQFTTGGDNPKVGRILFSPNEASGIDKGTGKLVKGEMWHDASRANVDTEIGHETGQWVPVVAIDAGKINIDWEKGTPSQIDVRPQNPRNPQNPNPQNPNPQNPNPNNPTSGGGKRKRPESDDGWTGLPAGGLIGGSNQFPLHPVKPTQPQDGPGRSSGGCPVPVGGDRPGTMTGPRGGSTTTSGPGTGTGSGTRPEPGSTVGGTVGGVIGGSIFIPPTNTGGTRTRPPGGGGTTTSGGNPETTPGGGSLAPVPNPESQARDTTPGTGAPCPNKTGAAGGSTGGHPAVTTTGGAVVLGGRPASGGPGGQSGSNFDNALGSLQEQFEDRERDSEQTEAEKQRDRWKERHEKEEKAKQEEIDDLEKRAKQKYEDADDDRKAGQHSRAQWKENAAEQLKDKARRKRKRLEAIKEKNKRRQAYYEEKARKSRNTRGRFAESYGLGYDTIGPDFSAARPLTEGGYQIEVVPQNLQDAGHSIFELGDTQASDLAGHLGNGQGNWGDHNVANYPMPFFGEEGGPENLQDYAAWNTLAMRSLQSTVNGAFGGPGYLAANLAVIEEASGGNQPTGSVIGTRFAARGGERILVGNNQPTLQVISQAAAVDGGSISMAGAGLFEVVRDNQTSTVEDRRPAILIENDRGQPGQAKGDLIASHDGRFRVDAKARGTVSGLDVHRKPGESDGAPLVSIGTAPGVGQKRPCGGPGEEYVSVGETGLVSVGEFIKLGQDGTVCLFDVDEAPGEPEEGVAYAYASGGSVYVHKNGDASPVEVGGAIHGGTP